MEIEPRPFFRNRWFRQPWMQKDARNETADTFVNAFHGTGWNGVRVALRCLDVTCTCLLSFLLNDLSQTEKNELMSSPQKQNVDWEKGRMLLIYIGLKARKFYSFPPPSPPPHFYSQLSLNGHLYKTDSWCWSRPFLSHFTITKLSVRRTTDALKSSTDTCEVLNVTANYDVGKKTS